MERFKSLEDLSSQLEKAEEVLGTEFFVDPARRQEVLEADEEELKQKYPYRWEQYLKALRASEGTHREDFASARNYIRLINNLEGYIHSYEEDQPDGFLREHQQDAFHALARFFNEGHTSGYLDLPTGSGKTVIFAELVKALTGSREGRAPLKTLVLVPGQDLVLQTIGRDGKKGFGKFAPDIKTSAYYQDEKDLSGDVVVATYPSFLNLKKQGKIDPDFADLVICDEAHKALGRVTRKEIESISPRAIKIALTATSEYSDEKKVSDLFPELIHKVQLQEAIELGILSNIQGFLYKTEVKVKGEKVKGNEDYSEEVFEQLDQEARNQAAIKFLKTFVEQGYQGIIPCLPGGELAHARKIENLANQETILDPFTKNRRNLVVKTIAGTATPKEREDLYKFFDKGEIDAFTFVGTLETGWDHDRAKFLINLRPTRSKVVATQRLGRILRPNELNQNAIAVEFEDDMGEDAPYTVFDVFEQRSILQGGLLVDREKVKSLGLETSSIELPEELLTDLSIETQLSRELSVKEKPERVRRKEINCKDPTALRGVLLDPDVHIDLTNCLYEDFMEASFGGSLGYKSLTGRQILNRFQSGDRHDDIRDLLRFAGFELGAIDFNNPEHLKQLIKETPEIDYYSCTLVEFRYLRLGHSTRFASVLGEEALRGFGSHRVDQENLDNLLQASGAVVDMDDPIEVKELIQRTRRSHSLWTFEGFRTSRFWPNPRVPEIRGGNILRHFGTKKDDQENFDKLMVFIGQKTSIESGSGENAPVERPLGLEDMVKNSEILKNILQNPEHSIDLHNCKLMRFCITIFGKGTTYGEFSGAKILQNFGTKGVTKENLKKLLDFAGI